MTFRFLHEKNHPIGLAKHFLLGVDIGSTTIKFVVKRYSSDQVVWQAYRRHEARQAEAFLDLLREFEADFGRHEDLKIHVFMTGSGGNVLAHTCGGKYVHEVNAVALAVERYHPDARSVIELGGQDAKIILFLENPDNAQLRKFATMNDKCAGGTGSIIEKIAAKLSLDTQSLSQMSYEDKRIHRVAGKCGVFAETDINSLQKQGVPSDELIASLYESIVQQNLSVLTRGHTLKPQVLLLGGPNYFLKGLQECWRQHIWDIWEDRSLDLPADATPENTILVPSDAHYFGALGTIEYGRKELRDNINAGAYLGISVIERHLKKQSSHNKRATGTRGLCRDLQELRSFLSQYQNSFPEKYPSSNNGYVKCFLGIDAGSTSTKAVLIDSERNVLAKAYQLSAGNPIEDARNVIGKLRNRMQNLGISVELLGVATTGYAKDILKEAIGADVALVETVAHAQSALHFYPNVDVICDVGGQDIKVLLVRDGVVRDFRLNTQCSAGNGYYLQTTAEAMGIPVEHYADVAFRAEYMPVFSPGCAVFLQSDIVSFQRQGWSREELLAGLAAVLPKNIWLYVCQTPNLIQLGRTFVLQGGTQHNLAAVKAQVDFIQERFANTGVTPEIIIHEHCGEAGAIGCAFEVERLYRDKPFCTSFIGFDALENIRFTVSCGEETTCRLCSNRCLRTFIDVTAPTTKTRCDDKTDSHDSDFETFSKRIILAGCEKGQTELKSEHIAVEQNQDLPINLSAYAAAIAFEPVQVERALRQNSIMRTWRNSLTRKTKIRENIRIGIPRVLNMFGLAPFFMGYFQSLGIPPENIIWSDYTTDRLYREGIRRGSIDPCFPSKLCIAHVHNLLENHHKRYALTHIFMPMIETVPSFLTQTQGCFACPTATATPESVHAAFRKEGDLFAASGIRFKKTFLNLSVPGLCAKQITEDWAKDLLLDAEESYLAVLQGMRALQNYRSRLRQAGKRLLNELKEKRKLGIVLLARPYHNDSGINHGICAEFQRLGYPILTLDSLPTDLETLEEVFAQDRSRCSQYDPLSIDDVWKNSFSENSSRKIWGAKFVARHPNLIGLELSNFKCGHDAAISSVVQDIIEHAGKPFFYFRDIDENKPTGSIRIRIETIRYFLKKREESLNTPTTGIPLPVVSTSKHSSRQIELTGEEKLPASVS